MADKIAVVTNVLDYVGPPAVSALVAAGFKVVAHDPAFSDDQVREQYLAGHPDTLPKAVQDPKRLIGEVADTYQRMDVLGEAMTPTRPSMAPLKWQRLRT